MNEQNPNLIELPMLRNWGNGEWRKHSACAGVNPDTFFPTKDNHSACSYQIATSRLTCATCTVRRDCLMFALENGEHQGIWGGVVPRERRKLDINNLDHTMPVSTIIKDLRKVRGKNHKTPFIQHFAEVLGVSVAKAKHLIANASTERL
jgi:WhiB family redox-sensing transcriptional regulator